MQTSYPYYHQCWKQLCCICKTTVHSLLCQLFWFKAPWWTFWKIITHMVWVMNTWPFMRSEGLYKKMKKLWQSKGSRSVLSRRIKITMSRVKVLDITSHTLKAVQYFHAGCADIWYSVIPNLPNAVSLMDKGKEWNIEWLPWQSDGGSHDIRTKANSHQEIFYSLP